MKKFFIAGFLWEMLRFFLLVFSAQKKTGSEMILWLASQQLVLFYLYFFLWYNIDRYCHYMKAAAAGKFLGIAAGALYLAGLFIRKAPAAGIFFTLNIILVDTVIMVSLLFLMKKYACSSLLRE